MQVIITTPELREFDEVMDMKLFYKLSGAKMWIHYICNFISLSNIDVILNTNLALFQVLCKY